VILFRKKIDSKRCAAKWLSLAFIICYFSSLVAVNVRSNNLRSVVHRAADSTKL